MSALSIPLAAVAGGLTILSPCILPIAPVVLTSALTQHRLGALALSLGLGISFAIVGIGLALFEAAFNFDGELLKQGGALVMLAIGLAMLAPKSFPLFATVTAPLSQWAHEKTEALDNEGLAGQFGLGLLLALIWSPCVGPTLGSAFALASDGESLGAVALTMLAFAFGASGMLLALSFSLQAAVSANKKWLQSLAKHGRAIFAVSIILVAILSLSGLDGVLGEAIVTASPDWVVQLTTRF
jgi:cytochrome c-type biogenesis protein